MPRKYDIYNEITKEVLDRVRVGDLVKCNDWNAPYRVKGVSENYFVMTRKIFGKQWYSICEKKPWPGVKHNAMRGGMFHIGPDNMIFGAPYGYDFDDARVMEKYLEDLESGKIAISERNGCPVTCIAIKQSPRAGT